MKKSLKDMVNRKHRAGVQKNNSSVGIADVLSVPKHLVPATEPIAVSVRRDGEWMLIHRCNECSVLKANRIAGDDNEVALLSLAVRPVAQPPFPLDGLYSGQDK